ncbi:MAG: hypothetical protein J3T61_00395 [Candidatus Brocadiales bacterium]|nr:hypothetical protein [Candidatus Bathyanammoxibius sp.]
MPDEPSPTEAETPLEHSEEAPIVELPPIETPFQEEAEQQLVRESIESDRKKTEASFMSAFNKKFEQAAHARKAAEEALAALGPYKDVVEFAQGDERFRDHMQSALRAYEAELAGSPVETATTADPISDAPLSTFEDVDPEVIVFLDKYIKDKGFVRQEEIVELREYVATGRQAQADATLRDSLAEGGLLTVYDGLENAGRIDAEIDSQRRLGNVVTREDAFWKIAGKDGLLADHAKAVALGEVQEKVDATVPESEALGIREPTTVDMSEMSAEEMEKHLPKAPGADDVKPPY